jgi:PleD family two-component response regulator
MLPKIDGLEILKAVKGTEAVKDKPVVLLTNLGRESIIKEGFALGADGYLIKSEYDPGQVVQEVERFLELGS